MIASVRHQQAAGKARRILYCCNSRPISYVAYSGTTIVIAGRSTWSNVIWRSTQFFRFSEFL